MIIKGLCSFFIVSLFIIFSACSSDSSVYGNGDDSVDIDWGAEQEDRIPQKRPDDAGSPGKPPPRQDENGVPDDEDHTYDDGDFYNDNDPPVVSLYETEPDVSECYAGKISSAEKQKVLIRINFIRSLHDLPPVTYEEDDDIYTSECALLIAANKKLDHNPSDSWSCYSKEGRTGCQKSNIYIRYGMISQLKSESIVDAFMTDEGVPTLGHRRWFLDPWLKHISFGRVDDFYQQVVGSAIKVNNDDNDGPIISENDIPFVAYPFESYPKELYNDNVMMSFTLINDKNNKWQNSSVNFSSAAIVVKDPSNTVLKISGVANDNDGYGVPNNLRWFAEGVENNVRYDVVITNVLVNSVSRNYSYWFKLE